VPRVAAFAACTAGLVAGCGGTAASRAARPQVKTATATQTTATHTTVARVAGPVYWGARLGTAPPTVSAIDAFAARVHARPAIVAFELPFASCATVCQPVTFPTGTMDEIRTAGAVPLLSLGSGSAPTAAHEPAYTLAAVASGRYDAYLQAFARAAAAWRHQFFLRFDWDMNSNWAPWGSANGDNSPSQFIAAWRHVWTLFRAAGATNATWVWCPSAQPGGRRTAPAQYYPGGRYVDWTCMTGFADDPAIGIAPNHQTPVALFGPLYGTLTQIAHSKPVMIGEVAQGSGQGEVGWITSLLGSLPQAMPSVHAIVWSDVSPVNGGALLEDSADGMAAFRAGVHLPAYRSGRAGSGPVGPLAAPANG
jgi:hypothetical protein